MSVQYWRVFVSKPNEAGKRGIGIERCLSENQPKEIVFFQSLLVEASASEAFKKALAIVKEHAKENEVTLYSASRLRQNLRDAYPSFHFINKIRVGGYVDLLAHDALHRGVTNEEILINEKGMD